jgi:protein SCO1/2
MNKVKKDWSYILISFVVLMFGIWSVPKIISKFSPEELVSFEEVPSFEFINQDGELINNDFFKGKVYVVEFFFTKCPTICPVMNTNMLKIQDHYYGNPNFGIASISIDTRNDTPEVLKAYARDKGATMKNWEFLTGDKESIFKFSKDGFKIYVGENDKEPGGFEHSGLFALVDKNGFIRSRTVTTGEYTNPIKFYDGLDLAQIQMLKEDIKILLDEQ